MNADAAASPSDSADVTTAQPAAAVSGGGDERLAYRGVFQRLLVRPEIGAIIGAIAIWAFFWTVSEGFPKANNILPVFAVASTLGIMAVAVAMLMIGGEFDLSAGAATGALGIVTILLVKDIGELGGAGLNLWVAIPISLLVALGLGWFNGTMVERTGLPSFIVTLATFFILRGFKLGFSKLIIDNITVGRIDEGEGYDFFVKLFGSDWSRNNHVLSPRDLIHFFLLIGGMTLISLGVHEINFRRRKSFNAAGLPVLIVGAAAAVGGVLMLHNTDGTSANTIGALIISGGVIVGFFGLGLWRYQPQAMGKLELRRDVAERIIAGLVITGLGVVSAMVLDVNSQKLVLDLVGSLRWVIVLVAAVVAGISSYHRLGVSTGGPISETVQSIIPTITASVVGGLGAYAFMFLATEQGLRAILFALLVGAGFILLSIGASVGGRRSPATRSFVLLVLAAVVAGLAFFVRAQSSSPKFRSEVFSVMLGGAVILAAWAIVSAKFEGRRFADRSGDKLGSRLGMAGIAAVVIGVMVRLIFTVPREIEAGISPAQFRVDVVWFAGVTLLATFVLARTKFGSWVFAVGGNKQAARQIGVPAARTKTQLFMIVSVAAWIVGLLLAFRLNTIQSNTDNGLEFEYIIAAVVGGTLLTGGYGSAFGAAIGAFIMAMSKQGIPLSKWNSDWRFAFLGVILLTAVISNNFIRRKAEASR